jgi:hypothetical protein
MKPPPRNLPEIEEPEAIAEKRRERERQGRKPMFRPGKLDERTMRVEES